MILSKQDKLSLDATKLKTTIDYHRWVDYIELHAILNPDGEASIYEVLSEPWSYDKGFASALTLDAENAPDEKKDQIENATATRITDLIKYLKIRKTILKDNYPFCFSDDSNTLACDVAVKDSAILYVYLLLSANQQFLDKSYAQNFTKGFEHIAFYCAKKLLPALAEVRFFGTGATGDMKVYTGNRKAKLTALAQDMGVSLTPEFEAETVSPHDTGDAQLDIALWIPFRDFAGHTPLFLVQAGCASAEQNMIKKQYDIDDRKWKNRFQNIVPTPVMVTPVCYRRADGNWIKPSEILSVFIDRVRIMKLLADDINDLKAANIPRFNDFLHFPDHTT